jgi:ribosomal-protein-serine acetyltransferase
VLRTHRLEARAAICNGRGNGAMKKLGAQREGVLRHSFFRDGDYLDQVVWSILGEEWLARRNTTGRTQQSWASTAVH